MHACYKACPIVYSTRQWWLPLSWHASGVAVEEYLVHLLGTTEDEALLRTLDAEGLQSGKRARENSTGFAVVSTAWKFIFKAKNPLYSLTCCLLPCHCVAAVAVSCCAVLILLLPFYVSCGDLPNLYKYSRCSSH